VNPLHVSERGPQGREHGTVPRGNQDSIHAGGSSPQRLDIGPDRQLDIGDFLAQQRERPELGRGNGQEAHQSLFPSRSSDGIEA
jgi:hypothetical protein